MLGRSWYFAYKLTLAPERPPYVPSEQRVIMRPEMIGCWGAINELYRCETDAELTARHAIERAEYDRLNVDDGVAP